jgi:hypothetical protein
MTDMTTLFVLGLVGAMVATLIGFTWLAVRAVLWLVFFPLMLLKTLFGLVFGLFGLVFGLVFGVFGLVVAAGVGLVGFLALAAVFALPLVPLLLVGGLVWLAVKGTTALATTA